MAANARTPDALLRAFSQGVGLLVALACTLAFLSAALAFAPVIGILARIPIQPNQQALVALLLGFSLFCQHLKTSWSRALSLGLAAIAAIFCLLALFTLLFDAPTAMRDLRFPPGFGMLSGQELAIPSLPSTITLLLLALALLGSGWVNDWLNDLLTLTALGYLCVTALIVAFRIQHYYETAFALPTGALLMGTLALGILFSRPDRGVMRAITRETMVGVVLRRLIPTAMLAPSLIALALLAGQYAGFFDAPQSMFFAVLAMTVVSISLVAWNVTPLARAERARDEAIQALRESETHTRHLAAIVEASEDAIVTYDPQTWRITYWSQGAERLWGWSAEEALEHDAGFLLPLPDREKHFEDLSAIAVGERVRLQDIQAARRDGSIRDISISLFPVRDPQGRLVAFGSIQRDFTAIRKALEEVTLRTAELEKSEELNRLKDHFLSTISHEMKTPLALIIGYTELLEETCPDQQLLEGIKEGSQRLSEHLDNILDYSALISGTLPLYRTDVNLHEVIAHVLPQVQEGFEQRGIALEVDVSPETPVIDADFRRISQILVELLENAWKFTPIGGKAGVRIFPDDGSVRLDVWNTGEGIPEEDFGRIWEAFSQLALADAFRKGGLGLGLTIVKRLTELHGGRVAVTSQVGVGSTFTVYLPVSSPPERKAEGEGPSSSVSEPGQAP